MLGSLRCAGLAARRPVAARAAARLAAPRRLAPRRVLVLLAALALLLNFLGGVRMHLAPHDRFDFSAALCLSSGAAPADRPASSAPPKFPADSAASCCPLCCGGGFPLAATPPLPPIPVARRLLRLALPAGLPARFAGWLPQHPRAPPQTC